MAFSRRRRREEVAVEPEIAAGPRLEGRHFFKIILSDTLESGKLGIPKSFLRRCGKDLSNSVLLQVPGGSTWTIGLEKCHNDMVSLWKGWREFMEYYSIGHGHLIVFEYKGNSTFCVIIFNKSASEIDYSLSSGETSYLGSKFPSPKTEDIVEAEDLAPRRRMRVEPHLPYSQLSPIYSPRGSEGVTLHLIACINTDPKEPDLSQAQADSTERIQQSTCRVSPSELVFHGPTLPRPLTPELACKFDLEHPFFKTVIPRSYMTCLSIPNGFIKQHIQDNKGLATLRFSGKSWPVKLLSYTETRRTKKRSSYRVFFSTGWPAFASENCLRVGDVCMFELIDGDNFVFKVSIFHSAACIDTDPEEPDLSQAQADSTDRIQPSTCRVSHSQLVFHGPTLPRPLTPPELACKFDSEHPFFKTVITRSYLCYLSIPAGFIKQHIQENKGMATLRFSGKSWPVKLLRCIQTRKTKKLSSYTHQTRVFFSTGWLAFARETHMHVGNICVFELIDRDDVVFRVSIFRSVACVDTDPKEPDLSQAQADSTERIQQSICRMCPSELVFHGPALPRPLTPELACKFDSEHPFFKTVIRRSYMTCLSIPVGFIKQHIQENKGMATLRFSGKSWPVKLLSYTETRARKNLLSYTQTRKTKKILSYTHETRVFFSSGWAAFARETHIRAGNICAFELIDRDDVVFRVSIFSTAGGTEQSTCRAVRSEPDFHGPTLPRSLTSLELASSFDTEHPFFKLVMPQSYMSYLRVPVGFAHQHIQENKQIASLRYSDRSWPVKLTRSPARAGGTLYPSFSAGWRAFARETNLHAGDVCVFELINRDDTVFKVSILSGADNDPIEVDGDEHQKHYSRPFQRQYELRSPDNASFSLSSWSTSRWL